MTPIQTFLFYVLVEPCQIRQNGNPLRMPAFQDEKDNPGLAFDYGGKR